MQLGSVSDSHRVITQLGVHPTDENMHVAMDCYLVVRDFTVPVQRLVLQSTACSTITYPQFVIIPGNLLWFVYCTGIEGSGVVQLAEYGSSSRVVVILDGDIHRAKWSKKLGS